MDSVVQHALTQCDDTRSEILVLVQPTSPRTSAQDLRAVVQRLRDDPRAACALTAHAVPPATAFVLERAPNGLSRFAFPTMVDRRTQDIPALAVPTGGAYAAPIERLRLGRSLVAEPVAVVLVDPDRAVDIDSPADLARARAGRWQQ
jgi:N-acylneuraminate cytidylyltransferase